MLDTKSVELFFYNYEALIQYNNFIQLNMTTGPQSQYMEELNQFTKQSVQNTTNAIGHLAMVENLVREGDRDLQEYHKLIELFRQELTNMKNRIQNTNEEIVNTTNPLIESLYKQLQRGMINQKDQNANFQDQLTDLKKEKSILNQMIGATSKRTQALNEQVGHY